MKSMSFLPSVFFCQPLEIQVVATNEPELTETKQPEDPETTDDLPKTKLKQDPSFHLQLEDVDSLKSRPSGINVDEMINAKDTLRSNGDTLRSNGSTSSPGDSVPQKNRLDRPSEKVVPQEDALSPEEITTRRRLIEIAMSPNRKQSAAAKSPRLP